MIIELSVAEIPDMVYARRATLAYPAGQGISEVAFRVETRAGGRAEDIHVTYTRDYLVRKGYLDTAAATVTFPIFGLYAEHDNRVEVTATLADGRHGVEELLVTTGAFPRPGQDLADVIVHRYSEEAGVSYIAVESYPVSVIVIDIDGAERWIAPDVGETVRGHLYMDDYWLVGSSIESGLYHVNWDGSFETHEISDTRFFDVHHNIDPAKRGLFNNVSFRDGAVYRPESVLIEMEPDGQVLKTWDFDEIFLEEIGRHGEDASHWIANGRDWFHMNAAFYDPTDDGVLASSRENFVVKVDYDTGRIRWILGNPEKRWYTDFPNSLQPLALELTGRPPIGQHALTVSPDGSQLLLFNNGWSSIFQLDLGDTQDESVISLYEIDEEAGTATEIWQYDHSPSLYSPVCSSVQWLEGDRFLAAYAQIASAFVDGEELGLHSRLVLVNRAGEVLFEASVIAREFDITSCLSVYKAKAIGLEDMRL